MKRIWLILLAGVLTVVLCGCSLQYSTTEDDGPFSYACSNKDAFLYEYRWDGTEEGMTIAVPDSYGSRKVTAVGGFFGRGLPMPFCVDASRYFENMQGEWLNQEPETGADETITLTFVLKTGKNVKEFRPQFGIEYYSENGKVTRYEIQIQQVSK